MAFNTWNRVHIAGVFVVMTVKTEVLPVASIGRIVVVIMVFVVYGQFVQVLTSELAPASPTHPGVNLERLCPIVALAVISILDRLGNHRVEFFL